MIQVYTWDKWVIPIYNPVLGILKAFLCKVCIQTSMYIYIYIYIHGTNYKKGGALACVGMRLEKKPPPLRGRRRHIHMYVYISREGGRRWAFRTGAGV